MQVGIVRARPQRQVLFDIGSGAGFGESVTLESR